MKTVLIYRDILLPISETFIQAQASALVRYKAQFVGVARAKQSLTLVDDPIIVLPDSNTRMGKLRTRLYYRAGIAPKFHRAVRAAHPAIIHAHFAPSGRNAEALAKNLSIPLVVTLHGHDVTTKQDYERMYRGLWQYASLFICVSDFIRRRAIAAGFPEKKMKVHYIGVDRELFSSAIDRKVAGLVLFVGRLVEKKGCAYLLAAMSEVEQSCPGSRLVVIGDGPLRSTLVREATMRDIRCTFLGSAPRTIVRQYLKRATVLCVPSVTASDGDSEGLPTVIMEALAAGTAIVSTIHAGIPEIIDTGKTGLLVPERDPSELAYAIARALQEDDFRLICEKAGMEEVRCRFDLKQQTAGLEDLYDEVLRNGSTTC